MNSVNDNEEQGVGDEGGKSCNLVEFPERGSYGDRAGHT